MMGEWLPAISIAIASLSFGFVMLEKAFGGGNALANKFHTHETATTRDMTALRIELTQRVDSYEDNYAASMELTRDKLHQLQLDAMEQRAKFAEQLQLYMPRSEYRAGIEEIKTEMRAGFEKLDAKISPH